MAVLEPSLPDCPSSHETATNDDGDQDMNNVWTTTLTSGLAPKRGANKDWTSLIRYGLEGRGACEPYLASAHTSDYSAVAASTHSASHNQDDSDSGNTQQANIHDDPSVAIPTSPAVVFGGGMTLSIADASSSGHPLSFPYFPLVLGYSSHLKLDPTNNSAGAVAGSKPEMNANNGPSSTVNHTTPLLTAISDIGCVVSLPPLELFCGLGGDARSCEQSCEFVSSHYVFPFSVDPV